MQTILTKEPILAVENGDVLAAVQDFLRQVIESGAAEAVFVPMEVEAGAVVPALVTDPALLDRANPLAPVMPINSARAISALTGKKPAGTLAAVLRPCELRALIELVKLQQASLEGVTLIGLDCPGSYEVGDYIQQVRHGSFDLKAFLASAFDAEAVDGQSPVIRPACQMCDQPFPEQADVHLHLFGVALEEGIPITVKETSAARLPFVPAGTPPETGGRRVQWIDKRRSVRERELGAVRTKMNSNGGLGSLFAECIRCHNCMTVCPICYCKTCLFKTASFDHPPEHYLSLARRKGATRLLGDTMLFHMTRLNHMSLSCVSCGMCTSACPADIPVGAIFSAIGAQVQSAFEYTPGRDVTEALPLITFQANEWTEIGE